MKILVLNSGSSSQKICLFDLADTPDDPPVCLWDARVEWDDSGPAFAANILNGGPRPGRAAIYPGPYEWWDEGIRRYGFHGIISIAPAGRHSFLAGTSRRSR